MQVGEIVIGALRTLDGREIGLELDEVTRHETRGEAEAAQDLDEDPCRVAAGAGAQRQRLVGRLDARLHADDVTDVLVELKIQVDQKVGELLFLAGNGGHIGVERGAAGLELEIGRELHREIGLVDEGKRLGVGLDEEIEGIPGRHFRDEIDLDREMIGLVGKDAARLPVAVRVLLPVLEMRLGKDLERIARHLRPAVRRGAQPDDLRTDRDVAVIGIGGEVAQRDLDSQ